MRNLRAILEAVVEWGQREQNVVLLVEYVRVALGRQICFRCADRDRVIAAYMLERSVEDLLRSATRARPRGTYMTLTEEATQPVIDEIARVPGGSGTGRKSLFMPQSPPSFNPFPPNIKKGAELSSYPTCRNLI